MKSVLLLFVLGIVLLSGCVDVVQESVNPTIQINTETGPTINEYFGKTIDTYSEQIIKTKLKCESGSCPNTVSTDEDTQSEEDCFFCKGTKVLENHLDVIIGQSGSSGNFGNCTEKRTTNEIVGLFNLTEKTEDKITAEIFKTGSVERKGDNCKDKYRYTWETKYKWTFLSDPNQ